MKDVLKWLLVVLGLTSYILILLAIIGWAVICLINLFGGSIAFSFNTIIPVGMAVLIVYSLLKGVFRHDDD